MSESHASPSSDRAEQLRFWLATLGFGDTQLAPASADASFRQYFRLRPGSGDWPFQGHDSLIVMDAPPDKENSEPFLTVARGLADIGVPVPEVLADDLEAGFLLLSDLGQRSLLDCLDANPALTDTLYRQADVWLHRLQAQGDTLAAAVPPYDEALLRREMALFRDWLCGQHLGLQWSDADDTAWDLLQSRLIVNARQQPQVLTHRDYHSRNLMVDDELGLWMIDFQDAVRGPFTYDLVSLLRDCYIEWPYERVRDWALAWFDGSPLAVHQSEAQNLRWFWLTGVQRQLKAAGIFARLGHRDGKWGYLDDVPRTLGYIVALAADYPELDWLVRLINERCLPALDRSR